MKPAGYSGWFFFTEIPHFATLRTKTPLLDNYHHLQLNLQLFNIKISVNKTSHYTDKNNLAKRQELTTC